MGTFYCIPLEVLVQVRHLFDNTLQSSFADCRVSANGVKISSASGHYEHECFMKLIFLGLDAKRTWLICPGCEYKSDPTAIPNATFA